MGSDNNFYYIQCALLHEVSSEHHCIMQFLAPNLTKQVISHFPKDIGAYHVINRKLWTSEVTQINVQCIFLLLFFCDKCLRHFGVKVSRIRNSLIQKYNSPTNLTKWYINSGSVLSSNSATFFQMHIWLTANLWNSTLRRPMTALKRNELLSMSVCVCPLLADTCCAHLCFAELCISLHLVSLHNINLRNRKTKKNHNSSFERLH